MYRPVRTAVLVQRWSTSVLPTTAVVPTGTELTLLGSPTCTVVRISLVLVLVPVHGTAVRVHLTPELASRGGPIPYHFPVPVFLLSPPRRRCNPAVNFAPDLNQTETCRTCSMDNPTDNVKGVGLTSRTPTAYSLRMRRLSRDLFPFDFGLPVYPAASLPASSARPHGTW